jgi:hypothetical protein
VQAGVTPHQALVKKHEVIRVNEAIDVRVRRGRQHIATSSGIQLDGQIDLSEIV